MLVYLREPMGYTQLEGKRIYGRKYAYGSFGPADIPYKTYKANKGILIEADYTPEWLENKFGVEFPRVTFKVSDFSKMDFRLMADIANRMGVKYVWSASSKNPTLKQRNALKRSIVSFLDS